VSSGFSILCPVDFSEPSRTALRYAAAIANHFGATLTLLAVDNPLLAEAAAATGRVPAFADETREELWRFGSQTLESIEPGPCTVDFRVTVGKPGPEILLVARELRSDLIVMSSRGQGGARKMFFGSTTERVLRDTTVPVLVTPADDQGAMAVSTMANLIHRIIVPVDFVPISAHQLAVAAGLAEAFSIPLVVTHVMEPVFIPPRLRIAMPKLAASRRADVDDRLAKLTAPYQQRAAIETVVVAGEPAEEIVKLAEARDAQLIVMGLHSSGVLGPRMGSVTYRVLCLARSLVLALPPRPAATSASFHGAGAVPAIA
jgi:nucleotide-binding universal stress UspA family protein